MTTRIVSPISGHRERLISALIPQYRINWITGFYSKGKPFRLSCLRDFAAIRAAFHE